jgi:hypothetical protein
VVPSELERDVEAGRVPCGASEYEHLVGCGIHEPQLAQPFALVA